MLGKCEGESVAMKGKNVCSETENLSIMSGAIHTEKERSPNEAQNNFWVNLYHGDTVTPADHEIVDHVTSEDCMYK